MKQDKISKTIKNLLELPYWPPELEIRKEYFRTQDDCDGDLKEGISVNIGLDGDVWVNTTSRKTQTCRYRTFFGGGRSPRVRNALLFLAIAIKMDNEESAI